MSTESAIQWTDATWNPVTGCTLVSDGCTNCYAAQLAATRLKDTPRYKGLAQVNSRGVGVFNGTIRLHEDKLLDPLKWRKPRRVFVNSMSDLFHPDVVKATITDKNGVTFPFLAEAFAVMVRAKRHTFQILTKRPELMAAILSHPNFRLDVNAVLLREGHPVMPGGFESKWPSHIWCGTSIESQEHMRRLDYLKHVPAAVRFLSCEPLLSALDFNDGPMNPDNSTMGEWSMLDGIHWVIVGGESGKHARPMEIAWARSIVEQCKSAEVPVFVKQLGRWIGIAGAADCDFHARYLLDDYNTVFVPGYFWKGVPDDAVAFGLIDNHGGRIEEFPEDLRIRQFPAPADTTTRNHEQEGLG